MNISYDHRRPAQRVTLSCGCDGDPLSPGPGSRIKLQRAASQVIRMAGGMRALQLINVINLIHRPGIDIRVDVRVGELTNDSPLDPWRDPCRTDSTGSLLRFQ